MGEGAHRSAPPRSSRGRAPRPALRAAALCRRPGRFALEATRAPPRRHFSTVTYVLGSWMGLCRPGHRREEALVVRHVPPRGAVESEPPARGGLARGRAQLVAGSREVDPGVPRRGAYRTDAPAANRLTRRVGRCHHGESGAGTDNPAVSPFNQIGLGQPWTVARLRARDQLPVVVMALHADRPGICLTVSCHVPLHSHGPSWQATSPSSSDFTLESPARAKGSYRLRPLCDGQRGAYSARPMAPSDGVANWDAQRGPQHLRTGRFFICPVLALHAWQEPPACRPKS